MDKYNYHTIIIGAGRVSEYFSKFLAKFDTKILVIDVNGEHNRSAQFRRSYPIQLLNSLSSTFASDEPLNNKFQIFLEEYSKKYFQLNQKYSNVSFAEENVEIIVAEPFITSANSLKIKDKTITFKNLIFAVGSSIRKLNIDVPCETIENWFNYNLPFNSVAIVGNDKYSVELASLFAILGVETTLINETNNIENVLSGETLEIYYENLKEDKLNIIENNKITNIQKNDINNKYEISIEGRTENLSVDRLITSGEFTSNIKNVKSKIKFDLNKNGYPIVDRYLAFKGYKNIYAMGSALGPFQNANQSLYHADIILRNTLNGSSVEEYDFLKYAIQINTKFAYAYVGMTEKDLKREKLEYKVFDYSFVDKKRILTFHEGRNYVRLFFSKDKKHVLLGGYIMGDHTTNISSFLLYLYHSRKSIISLENFSPFDYSDYEIFKDIVNKYIQDNIFTKKRVDFISKWYLKH